MDSVTVDVTAKRYAPLRRKISGRSANLSASGVTFGIINKNNTVTLRNIERNIALRNGPAKGGKRNVRGVYIYKYIYPDVTPQPRAQSREATA